MGREKLLSAIHANPTVGIAVADTCGRLVEVNSAFCHFVGYPQAECYEFRIEDFYPLEDQAQESKWREQLLTGRSEHLTHRKRFITKEGKPRWGDTNMTVARDASGSPTAIVAMVVDVTDQRRQKLLQDGQSLVLEKLYRKHTLEDVCETIVETIEAVEEGLLCSILQLNSVSGTLHRLAAPSLPDFYNGAIEGMKVGAGVGSCGAAAYSKQRVVVADILNHPYWERAKRLVEKTELRSCWSQPIFDNDNNVLGTFAIYYAEPREPGPFELDLITSAAELAALAINHNRALRALQKSDQLKSEFISTAAHELRTPVTSIMGFTELLSDPEMSVTFDETQKQEFMGEIYGNCLRLDRIIDDILDVSRIEAGHRIPLDKKLTSLPALLRKISSHFTLRTTHQVELEIKHGMPEGLLVDEHRISQVLENLLSNAIKYSPEACHISVVAERDGDSCKVTVSDQGIGMTRQQLTHIFDKFYRADASDTSVRGLGLGMSIVKQIIEDHGGTIGVESSLNKGTQVHFTLPI